MQWAGAVGGDGGGEGELNLMQCTGGSAGFRGGFRGVWKGVPWWFRGVPWGSAGVPRGFRASFRGGSAGVPGGSGGFRVGTDFKWLAAPVSGHAAEMMETRVFSRSE